MMNTLKKVLIQKDKVYTEVQDMSALVFLDSSFPSHPSLI